MEADRTRNGNRTLLSEYPEEFGDGEYPDSEPPKVNHPEKISNSASRDPTWNNLPVVQVESRVVEGALINLFY